MKYTALLMGACLAFTSCQKGRGGSSSTNTEEWNIYHQALKLGDYGTAAYAVNAILARDTTQINLYDTLAGVYIRQGNLTSTVNAANVFLKKNPQDINTLDLMARTMMQGGRFDLAVPYLTRLKGLSKQASYGYDLALCHLNNQEYESAAGEAMEIINNPKADSTKVEVFFGPNNSQHQTVLIKAAAMNLLGAARLKLNDKKAGQEYIEKAVALQPDYIQAKQNLDYIKNHS